MDVTSNNNTSTSTTQETAVTAVVPSLPVSSGNPQPATAEFRGPPGTVVGSVPPSLEAGRDTDPTTGHFESFFSEYTKLANITWGSTSAQGVQLFNDDIVTYLLSQNQIMLRKLSNFARVTWDAIEVKFLVNGSATLYGHAVVQAVPQGVEYYGTGTGTFQSGTLAPRTHDALPTIWQAFHGVHADLLPTSEPIILELPWISNQDALFLKDITTTGPLGGGPQTQWRYLVNVVAPLRNSTNMAAINNCTISVFARFKGFRLTVPVAYQSGKGKARPKERGRIGKIAGAVGEVATALKGVPFVSEVAAGVELVSGAIGTVADYFGFTRVTDLAQPDRVQLHALPGLPHADGWDTSVPLSILRSNKVSIDPSIGGDGDRDVEAFGDVFRRKSLIATATWSPADVFGTSLITQLVGPSQARYVDPPLIYLAPFAYVATQFEYWRGPLFYELRVIGSAQHSGRLQLVYYPYDAGGPYIDPTNTSHNAVIDVEGDTSYTFRIGWTRAEPFLKVGDGANFASTPLAETCNGYFKVYIVNELTAPDPTATVTVELYVYADETLELANPRPTPANLQLQSEMVDLVPSGDKDVSGVYMGEKISSIRTLAQRPQLWSIWYPNIAFTTNADPQIVCQLTQFFPTTPYEADTGVMDPFCPVTIAPGQKPMFPHPLKWFSHLFLGWRGSVRYKIVVLPSSRDSAAASTGSTVWWIPSLFVQHYSRVQTGQSTSPQLAQAGTYVGTPPWQWISEISDNAPSGNHYQDLTSLGNIIEFTVPHYYPRRFNLCRVVPAGDDGTDQGGDIDPGASLLAFVNTPSSTTGHLANGPAGIVIASAGDDFSYQRFRFVPRITYTGS